MEKWSWHAARNGATWAEIDARAREARLRLEHIERLLLTPVLRWQAVRNIRRLLPLSSPGGQPGTDGPLVP